VRSEQLPGFGSGQMTVDIDRGRVCMFVQRILFSSGRESGLVDELCLSGRQQVEFFELTQHTRLRNCDLLIGRVTRKVEVDRNVVF
jgi:hypothetical protein